MHTITPRPKHVAAFLVATTDHNNAFSDARLNLLIQIVQKTHFVIALRMKNADIQGALRGIKNTLKRPIKVLCLFGHGSPTTIIFHQQNGVYDIKNIAKHHFQDLDPSASIYFMSCNTAPLARKITELTHLTTYAPNGTSSCSTTILLPTQTQSFDLIQYNLKLSVITEKHEWTKENDSICTPLNTQESLHRLLANTHTGNAAVLYVLGAHFFNGTLVEKNTLKAFSYFYESATYGYFYAQRTLERLHVHSPKFFSIAAYYLALLHIHKPTRFSQITGYEYLIQSTLDFYPPAMNLLSQKAQENNPLALFYWGKQSEAQANPIFLDYYLKAALLGEEKAYPCLVKAHAYSPFPSIRGRAALYLGHLLATQNTPLVALCYFEKAESLNIPGAKEAIAFVKKTARTQLEELKKKAYPQPCTIGNFRPV